MNTTFDVPRIRTRTVDRPRLRLELGSGNDRPSLAVVHGSAGSGKSTLLAQWATGVELGDDEALQWITLHDDDAGQAGFWNRIAEALARNGLVGHVLSPDILTQLGTRGAPPPRPTRAGLALTLVLDDYQLVATPAIDEQLRHVLKAIDGLRLVVGTRATGGLHSVELAASVDTVVLSTQSLAFTVDESQQLATLLGINDKPELARAVHDASVGWPLATHALLVETSRDPESHQMLARSASAGPQFVSGFVMTALASRGAAEADFLLASSLADECTAQLAAHITATPLHEATAWLDQLEASGVGTWQLRSDVRWFRMHPLLREGFVREAHRTLSGERLSQVRGLLSEQVREERPLLALELAFAMQDWTRFESVYLLSYVHLYFFHRPAVTEMLAQVPDAALQTRAALIGLRMDFAYGSGGGTLGELNRLFAMLREALRQHPLTGTGIMAALQTTAVMGSLRIMGDGAAAQELAGRVLALIDQASVAERVANARSLPIAYVEVANTYLLNGLYDPAIDALALARHSASTGPVSERFQSMSMTALTYALRGNITLAREWIRACDELGYGGWFVGYYDSGYYIAKAICALNDLDYAGVLAALEAPRTREHVIEYWPVIAMLDARVAVRLSNARDAYVELSATLARKRSRPPVTTWVQDDLAALAAELLILDGQPVRAATALGPPRAGEPGIVLLLRAKLARQRGDLERAIAFADEANWASTDSYRVRTEAMISVADLALEMGDEKRASESFAAAMAAIQRRGPVSSLMSVPTERLDLLAAVAENHGQLVDRAMLEALPRVRHDAKNVEPLSAAERRVLSTLLAVRDVATAAERLHLSEHTVRYHLKRTYSKLGVNSRNEALRAAQELGMLGESNEPGA